MILNPNVTRDFSHTARAEPALSLWQTAVFTVIGFLSVYMPGKSFFAPLATLEASPFIALAACSIGIPFAYILPTMKVSPMAGLWGVPKTTLLISRPLLRFICSATIGSAIGTLLGSVLVDQRLVLPAIAQLPIAGATVIATRRRFGKHAALEWTMPSPGYKIMLPLFRGFRVDE